VVAAEAAEVRISPWPAVAEEFAGNGLKNWIMGGPEVGKATDWGESSPLTSATVMLMRPR
jgi:hypothetical protein